ncbi:MAG: hypothetical protein ACM3ML_18200 [Micromonosporaceae bacterium]
MAEGRSRRVRLPGAAEFFRSTKPSPRGGAVPPDRGTASADATPVPHLPRARPSRPTGRERHTQKITVYMSQAELIDLEHARLALRAYGIAADRGRVVREAVAALLADLDANGEASLLVRRLHDSNQRRVSE